MLEKPKLKLKKFYFHPITVFIFFRFLDIKKPSIIGLAERRLKGGAGVMVDDLLAGLFAGIMSWGTYKALLFFGAI